MIRRLNFCALVLHPALQPTCSSAIIFSLLWLKSAKNDLQHDYDYDSMADKTDGSVILAQLQVSFHRRVITRDLVQSVGHSPVFKI